MSPWHVCDAHLSNKRIVLSRRRTGHKLGLQLRVTNVHIFLSEYGLRLFIEQLCEEGLGQRVTRDDKINVFVVDGAGIEEAWECAVRRDACGRTVLVRLIAEECWRNA